MLFKRGQGDIIAWVLLVGFAVSLAVLVGRWSLQQSQEASESIVSQGETDIRCDSIAIGANCEKIGEFGAEADYQITVSNKGSLKIAQLNIGGCVTKINIFCTKTATGDYIGDCLGLNKAEPITLNNCGNVITLVPMIYVDSKLVGCSAKEIDIETSKCT